MRSTIFVALAIMLGLGIFFARERLRLAFQVGAVLYAITLVARFFVFGIGDDDSLLLLLLVGAVLFLIWLAAWAGTNAILRRRGRTRRPRA